VPQLIEVEYSNNVWIDHVDVSSDRDHDKDYYDGLLDVSQPLTTTHFILQDQLTATAHPRRRLHNRLQQLHPRPLESLPNRPLGQQRRRGHRPLTRNPKQQSLVQH
jgi:hypothetical protein